MSPTLTGTDATSQGPASGVIEALRAVLPTDRLVTDPDVLGSYSHDGPSGLTMSGPPSRSARARPKRCRPSCAPASSTAEADAPFAARQLAYPAEERLGPLLTEDVCVPKAAVPAMLARIEEIGIAHETLIANIAHAGDGNLHPCWSLRQGRGRPRPRPAGISRDHCGRTGTRRHRHRRTVSVYASARGSPPRSPRRFSRCTAVKGALDPHGILNPGKVFAASPQEQQHLLHSIS